MEDGGWKIREKSQGNECQGNNPENAFSHSLDNHSPDFAVDTVFNRAGGGKILAKMTDSDGLPNNGGGHIGVPLCLILRIARALELGQNGTVEFKNSTIYNPIVLNSMKPKIKPN
jgi:hypothetical protein